MLKNYYRAKKSVEKLGLGCIKTTMVSDSFCLNYNVNMFILTCWLLVMFQRVELDREPTWFEIYDKLHRPKGKPDGWFNETQAKIAVCIHMFFFIFHISKLYY